MKAPWHLWVVGIVSLLWNAGGAFDYTMTQTQNENYMSNFSPQQLDYFYGFPTWVVAVWAIAVWAGLSGSVFLLLRSRLATWAFTVSLLGMVSNTFWGFAMSDTSMTKAMGPEALWFTLAIAVVAVALLWYARRMKFRGVLR
ncbi:MAG: hypothetical protein KUG69_10095 [Marinosulfonomonas sp.]|nr:hypothetical protein [Marinosulfonomonas sp.]